ncbi:MAG: hypothetical protein U0470_07185 [Anaerolineae bacterium]
MTELALGDTAAAPAAPPAASADEVGQLRAVVAAMHAELSQYGARLESVERRLDGQTSTPDGYASVGLLTVANGVVPGAARGRPPTPARAAALGARRRRRGRARALGELPAARRLLVGAALLPGHRIDIPGPGARTVLRHPARSGQLARGHAHRPADAGRRDPRRVDRSPELAPPQPSRRRDGRGYGGGGGRRRRAQPRRHLLEALRDQRWWTCGSRASRSTARCGCPRAT